MHAEPKAKGIYGINVGDLTLWYHPDHDGDSIGLILTVPDEFGIVVIYSAGRLWRVNWSQVRPIYRIDGTRVEE
jgi:hypothetical protein